MEDSKSSNETETVAEELTRFTLKVDEINKRSMGKAIIKFCGNEGSQDDKNKEKLRSLMQAAITHIEKERPKVWKNAEVKMYDENCDVYSIIAGDGKTKFVGLFDRQGSAKIIKSKHAGSSETSSNSLGCSLM